MTILEKENAILNVLASQGAVISQIAQSVASGNGGSVDVTALRASIDKLDAHVGVVQSLIGDDTPATAPTAAPVPAPAPTPVPDATPVPAPAPVPETTPDAAPVAA